MEHESYGAAAQLTSVVLYPSNRNVIANTWKETYFIQCNIASVLVYTLQYQ